MVVTADKLARVVGATVAVTVPVVKARKVATSPKAIVPAFTLKFLALRSEILGVVSEFTVEQVEGKTGRDQLADSIKDAINVRLEELEGFGGVEGVFFTSFVLQ